MVLLAVTEGFNLLVKYSNFFSNPHQERRFLFLVFSAVPRIEFFIHACSHVRADFLRIVFSTRS
jgi:hypothetical protein